MGIVFALLNGCVTRLGAVLSGAQPLQWFIVVLSVHPYRLLERLHGSYWQKFKNKLGKTRHEMRACPKFFKFLKEVESGLLLQTTGAPLRGTAARFAVRFAAGSRN